MVKQEQYIWRREMLALMNEDEEWYRKEDTKRFKRIQELAKKIETARTRQITARLTKETFDRYQKMGWQLKDIAEELNIPIKYLRDWRIENGYPIYKKNNRKVRKTK
ncbi:hypothetical protein IHQ39_13245 [Enterococcus faecalis]|uniref:hypothetical protein n=1 Tax=Enterococcus faecalis TaxID=1351 RepID=UPI001784BF50|nr:hypothetical protein [Enterococcus faecalis]MBD9966465.1 hypothetical protein [Enterococcus faecalis]MBD9974259.1 hypothetical protein [Enterococcus faecalis]